MEEMLTEEKKPTKISEDVLNDIERMKEIAEIIIKGAPGNKYLLGYFKRIMAGVGTLLDLSIR